MDIIRNGASRTLLVLSSVVDVRVDVHGDAEEEYRCYEDENHLFALHDNHNSRHRGDDYNCKCDYAVH